MQLQADDEEEDSIGVASTWTRRCHLRLATPYDALSDLNVDGGFFLPQEDSIAWENFQADLGASWNIDPTVCFLFFPLKDPILLGTVFRTDLWAPKV